MAALGEVPFGRYYGSVDATPLFVMLAGAYYRAHRRPRRSSSELWPAHRARARLDRRLRRPRRRRLRRVRAAAPNRPGPAGLEGLPRLGLPRRRHAGRRRRSRCARSRATSTPRCAGGRELATALGEPAARRRAATREAEQLRAALRGARSGARSSAPTRWRSTATSGRAGCARSNAGHCLFTGIADRPSARARVGADAAGDGRSFSGWGIRTRRRRRGRATTRCRTTTARSGRTTTPWRRWAGALRLQGSGHAAARLDVRAQPVGRSASPAGTDLRLPPARRRSPTLYPVACSPQAWSAARCTCCCKPHGTRCRRRSTVHHLPPGGAARGYPTAASDESGRRRRQGRPGARKRHANDVAVSVVNRVGDVELVGVK